MEQLVSGTFVMIVHGTQGIEAAEAREDPATARCPLTGSHGGKCPTLHTRRATVETDDWSLPRRRPLHEPLAVSSAARLLTRSIRTSRASATGCSTGTSD